MAALVDVNVLIAILHAGHQHSQTAVCWLDQQSAGEVLICRVVQMGALRILTSAAIFRDEAHSASEIWDAWEELMLDERFACVAEPSGLLHVWRDMTANFARGRSVDTDTYLAAMAVAGDWSLVSFDRGFKRYPGLKLIIPT